MTPRLKNFGSFEKVVENPVENEFTHGVLVIFNLHPEKQERCFSCIGRCEEKSNDLNRDLEVSLNIIFIILTKF